MRSGVAWLVACVGVVGCGGGGGGQGGAGGSAGDAAAIDAATGGGDAAPGVDGGTGGGAPVLDAAPPDAGTHACLGSGAMAQTAQAGDPIAGLRDVRADVDVEGDGAADLALTVTTDAGVELRFVDGRTLAPKGTVTAPAGATLDPMAGLWPRPDLLAPITVGGTRVLYVLERDADGSAALRLVSAADFSEVRRIALAGGVDTLTVLSEGDGWLAIVNQADKGCAIYDLEQEAAAQSQGRCRLQPAWDANGDGAVDLALGGGAGASLLDGRTLDPIAGNATANLMLGIAPAAAGAPSPGPADLRGQGPEVLGLLIARGQLELHFLAPDTLSDRGNPLIVPGDFERVEVWGSPEGPRVVAEETRNNLHYLRVLQPGSMLRRIAEFGGFVNLGWGMGGDVDGDGFPEIDLWSGPRDDGISGERVLLRARDGQPALSLPVERNARFDPVFAWRGGAPRPADLDGCPGDEVVLIRSGQASGGNRPTRLRILDASGAQLYQGEPLSGQVHVAAVADLDGQAPAELIEARSTDGPSAALFVTRF